jgi:class 3 adenylate cyclase
MKVVSMGSALASRFPALDSGSDLFLADILKMQRPAQVRQDFESFMEYEGQAFLAMVRDETYHQKNREKVMARRAARAAARGRLQHRSSDGSTASGCPFSTLADGAEDHLRKRSPSTSSSCSSVHAENFISQTVDYLYLRGELCYQKATDTLFLAGSPHVSLVTSTSLALSWWWVSVAPPSPPPHTNLFQCRPTRAHTLQITKVAEMYERDMSLADMPVHSNGRELLFGSLHASATIAIARTLEDTTESLDIARNEMNREKARVEELLHGILPPSIARQLASGHRPEAERYAGATILFSDVVGFTKLSSSVKPQAVMNMLNQLFSKFDDLCDLHQCFKVETIGDAYMVACGLPVPNDQHPVLMCRFALDMIRAAHSVKSPVDGSPLQIRIGMHTGPAMAGVVGLKAPRYVFSPRFPFPTGQEPERRPARLH